MELLKGPVRRQALLVVLLLLGGAGLAQLHVVSQSYVPIVRVAGPEGVLFTAVHEARQDRAACGEANDRFLRPVQNSCAHCRIVFARCERTRQPFEREIFQPGAAGQYQVFGNGVLIYVDGPRDTARAACDMVRSGLAREGYAAAVCVPARSIEIFSS